METTDGPEMEVHADRDVEAQEIIDNAASKGIELVQVSDVGDAVYGFTVVRLEDGSLRAVPFPAPVKVQRQATGEEMESTCTAVSKQIGREMLIAGILGAVERAKKATPKIIAPGMK